MMELYRCFQSGSRLITIFILFALMFLTLGQVGRLGFLGQPIFGYAFEPFVYAATAMLVFRYRLRPWASGQPIVRAMQIFFGWMGISLVLSCFHYSQSQNIVAFLYFIRLLSYSIFCIYFSHYLHHEKKLSRLFHHSLIVALGITLLFSIGQYLLYPNLGNIAYLGWDPHINRLVGLFFDPPLTVSVLGLFFFYFLVQWQRKKNSILVIVLVVLLGLIFLTYSRGGYLALAITLLFFAIQKLKPQHIVFLVVSFGILFFFIPKGTSESINLLRTTSIFTRAQDDQIALKIWLKNPLFGIGYNHIRVEKDAYLDEPISDGFNPSHAGASFHSSFIMILVTGGVIGLVFYGWMVYSLSTMGLFVKYAVVFLSVISLTDNVLLHPFILFLLFLMIPVSAIENHS